MAPAGRTTVPGTVNYLGSLLALLALRLMR